VITATTAITSVGIRPTFSAAEALLAWLQQSPWITK